MSTSSSITVVRGSGEVTPSRRILGIIPRPSVLPSAEPGCAVVALDKFGRAFGPETTPSDRALKARRWVMVDLAVRRHRVEVPSALVLGGGSMDATVDLQVKVTDPVQAAIHGGGDIAALIESVVRRRIREALREAADDMTADVLKRVLSTRAETNSRALTAIESADLASGFDWLLVSVVDASVEPDDALRRHTSAMQRQAHENEAMRGMDEGAALSDGRQAQRLAEYIERLTPTLGRQGAKIVALAGVSGDERSVGQASLKLQDFTLEQQRTAYDFLREAMSRDMIDEYSDIGRSLFGFVEQHLGTPAAERLPRTCGPGETPLTALEKEQLPSATSGTDGYDPRDLDEVVQEDEDDQ